MRSLRHLACAALAALTLSGAAGCVDYGDTSGGSTSNRTLSPEEKSKDQISDLVLAGDFSFGYAGINYYHSIDFTDANTTKVKLVGGPRGQTPGSINAHHGPHRPANGSSAASTSTVTSCPSTGRTKPPRTCGASSRLTTSAPRASAAASRCPSSTRPATSRLTAPGNAHAPRGQSFYNHYCATASGAAPASTKSRSSMPSSAPQSAKTPSGYALPAPER